MPSTILTIFAVLAALFFLVTIANPLPDPRPIHETPTAVVKRLINPSIHPTTFTLDPAPEPTTIVPAQTDSPIEVKTKCQKGCNQAYRACLANIGIISFEELF